MAWLIVFVSDSFSGIYSLSQKTWIFLVLSGIATGASWLCYFKALQIGDINKVVPVDKTSAALAIIFAFIFLDEKITFLKIICVILIGAGAFLMIEKKNSPSSQTNSKDKSCFVHSFCRRNFHFGKSGHRKRKFKPWYGNPHRSCACNGVAHSFCHRQKKQNCPNSQKRVAVHMPFGTCHRGFLAVLLQSPARRSCKRCCAH